MRIARTEKQDVARFDWAAATKISRSAFTSLVTQVLERQHLTALPDRRI